MFVRIASALAVFALLSAAPPAQAQQDAPMPREVRVLVQKGLAALGFDAGPADGLFGPRTRAAIWDWQKAKGLDASGYVTQEEAEALAAVGAEARERAERESVSSRPGATRERPATARAEPAATRKPAGKVLNLPRCSDISDGLKPMRDAARARRKSGESKKAAFRQYWEAIEAAGTCWVSVENHQDCDIWFRFAGTDATLSHYWSGKCEHNTAHGKGTLRIAFRKHVLVTMTGEMVRGKRIGTWVYKRRDGKVDTYQCTEGVCRER